jgi:hypothetical protein
MEGLKPKEHEKEAQQRQEEKVPRQGQEKVP